MIRTSRAENILAAISKPGVFIIIGLVLLLQMFALRGLFADASNTLVFLLVQEKFYILDSSRFAANWFTQFPVLLAIKAGVTDLHALTFLFSSWLLLAPALFWLLALWRLRADIFFWPFVLLFVFVFYGTGFFAIGEFNFSFALSAFCLAGLLARGSWKRSDYVLLPVAALLLIASYASTLFIGPLSFIAAILRGRETDIRRERNFSYLLAGIFAASSMMGLWAVLHPAFPGNMEGAAHFGNVRHDREFLLLLTAMILLGLNIFIRQRNAKIIVSTFVCLIAGIFIVRPIFLAPPNASYNIRAYASLVLWLAGLCFVGFRFFGRPLHKKIFEKNSNRPIFYIVPICTLLGVLSIFDMRASLALGRYIEGARVAVNSATGYIRYEDSFAKIPGSALYGWSWTNPALSLILRKDANGAIVLNAADYGGWQGFDARTELPDLQRYYAR
jgi:hypothetical protein